MINIVKPSVELLWVTPEPEKQIEISGRVCYKSEEKITDDSAGGFAKMMTKSGHHAMIEHAVASFRIITDRGIMAEITRHRISSFAIESTRYVNYNNKPMAFICPPEIMESGAYETWYTACEESEKAYQDLIRRGLKPQIARSVLPTCLKTEIVMTANFREWRHFINLRGAKAAHPQIRPIARMIYDILVELSPNVFGDLESVF